MRTTEFVQLLKKLYILVQTPLSMKLRGKDNVPKMYSFFLLLYRFLIVVQLFKDIQRRTTGFVQLWKKRYIFVVTPFSMKLRSKKNIPKIYSFFLWLWSYSKIYKGVLQNLYSFGKTVHLVQTPLSIKLRAKGNVFQRCTAFFFGCTPF